MGEWLTRKILRTMSEVANGIDSRTEAWRNAATSSADAYRTVAESAAAATRDTEDMLARVSRSEDETQSATKRIEDHLKGVARRLDSAERSQSENNRAMSKAAAEINIAAREQAQAFDQLDSHVMALSDRLGRVEQHASGTGGLKDAVKGLHTGLSRLADQIGETANQSATQIATLAQNIETLAGRLTQARQDAETAAKALRAHLLAVDERVRAVEKDDGAAKALGELRTSFDELTARMAESEAQTAGAMARLEGNVARLQQASEDNGFDARLAAIEQNLAELATRVDTPSVPDTLMDELHHIGERLEAADQQHRREIAELRESVEELEAARKVEPEPVHAPQPIFAEQAPPEPLPFQAPMNGAANGFAGPAMAQPPMAQPLQAAPPPQDQPAMAPPSEAMGGFDLPPFPQAAPAPDAPPFAHAAEPPPFDHGTGYPNEYQFSGTQAFDTALGNGLNGGFDGHNAASANGFDRPQHSAEDFIANTRRQARAAAEAHAAQAPANGFSWGAGQAEPAEPANRSRFVMIGLAVVLIIGALATGLFVFRNQAHAPQPAQPAVTAATPSEPPIVGSALPGNDTAGSDVTAPAQTDTTNTHAAVAPKPAPHHAKAEAKPAHKAPAPQKVAELTPMQKLTSAAKAGSATAETVLGLKYLDGDGLATNEAEGARWLERAAKQGQPIAEYRMGTLYERGHGVPADPKQAAMWYEAAAKQGNRKAMHNLAVAYAQGSGVPKNFTVAAQWFSKAANLGLRDSQFNLAVLYERGMGVPQSLSEAFKWYAIAAAQGDSESKARVAALSLQLKPGAREAAQRAADRFKPAELDRTSNVAPSMAAN